MGILADSASRGEAVAFTGLALAVAACASFVLCGGSRWLLGYRGKWRVAERDGRWYGRALKGTILDDDDGLDLWVRWVSTGETGHSTREEAEAACRRVVEESEAAAKDFRLRKWRHSF